VRCSRASRVWCPKRFPRSRNPGANYSLLCLFLRFHSWTSPLILLTLVRSDILPSPFVSWWLCRCALSFESGQGSMLSRSLPGPRSPYLLKRAHHCWGGGFFPPREILLWVHRSGANRWRFSSFYSFFPVFPKQGRGVVGVGFQTVPNPPPPPQVYLNLSGSCNLAYLFPGAPFGSLGLGFDPFSRPKVRRCFQFFAFPLGWKNGVGFSPRLAGLFEPFSLQRSTSMNHTRPAFPIHLIALFARAFFPVLVSRAHISVTLTTP